MHQTSVEWVHHDLFLRLLGDLVVHGRPELSDRGLRVLGAEDRRSCHEDVGACASVRFGNAA